MASREVQLATPLLKEVVQWVADGHLFASEAKSPRCCPYEFQDGTIGIRAVDALEWHRHIDINNEDSRYLDLMDLVGEISGAFGLIHQFGPQSFRDFKQLHTEQIRQHVVANDRVLRVAHALHDSSTTKSADLNECVGHLQLTMVSHFYGIIDSRAVSLSTRHAPMEALFHAYKQGLLPFGWDWESIICLDPKDLLCITRTKGDGHQ